ncbi:MAG: hypothetical protein LBB91_07190 [Clostridiales bacterium]|nr:hypothetical protein [Clostridiales bacterium]
MADTMMSNIHVRVPKADKDLAVAKLKNSGMDLSTAINIFIKQLIRQEKFPIEIYTEYQFPESVYHRLDDATANRRNTEYLTVDE